MSAVMDTKKGIGLVEVLVVLALVATTMVAAAQLSVNALRSIKNNEVKDYATGLLVQALEVAKSPDDINIYTTSALASYNGTYSLERGPTGTGYVLSYSSPSTTQISSCASDSIYAIDISAQFNVPVPKVCLQVVITANQGLAGNYYQISATTIYTLEGETIRETVIGYRRNEFKVQR